MTRTPPEAEHANSIDRRGLLLAGSAAAAASLLSACVIQQPESTQSTPSVPPADQTSPPDEAEPAAPDSADPPLVSLQGLPIGGGVVLGERKIVVTRDSSDAIHAFSAVCTHQGCAITTVSDGTINCLCHGSKFDMNTGRPVAGPATSPLPPVAIQRRGDAVFPA